jgi:hypothetical protein
MTNPRAPLDIMSRSIRIRRPRLSRRLSQLSVAGLIAPALVLAVMAVLAQLRFDPLGLLPSELVTNLAWLWGLGVPALTVIAGLVGALAPTQPGSLVVGDEGISLQRGRRCSYVPVGDIQAGLVVPSTCGAALDLDLADGRVLRVEMGAAEATAVLERLGLGPGRRRVTVPLRSEALTLFAGCGAFILSVLLAASVFTAVALVHPTGWLATSLLLVVAAVIALAPLAARWIAGSHEVVIGIDGVLIRRAGRARLVPIALIRRALCEHGALVLELCPSTRDGSAERLSVYGADPAVLAGLAARIEATLRRAEETAVKATAGLEPHGRSMAEWREALTRLMQDEGAYRRAPFEAIDLGAVLEGGRAPACRRIGAALALCATDQDGVGRAQVRRVATACAGEALRAALETAAEDEVNEGVIRRALRDPRT